MASSTFRPLPLILSTIPTWMRIVRREPKTTLMRLIEGRVWWCTDSNVWVWKPHWSVKSELTGLASSAVVVFLCLWRAFGGRTIHLNIYTEFSVTIPQYPRFQVFFYPLSGRLMNPQEIVSESEYGDHYLGLSSCRVNRTHQKVILRFQSYPFSCAFNFDDTLINIAIDGRHDKGLLSTKGVRTNLKAHAVPVYSDGAFYKIRLALAVSSTAKMTSSSSSSSSSHTILPRGR